jgi:acyl carrier protein
MSISQTLERFIVNEIMFGNSSTRLDPEQSLIESGVLDSLALLRLIGFIEEQFGVVIEDGEVVPDNFQTLNRAEAFVRQKL